VPAFSQTEVPIAAAKVNSTLTHAAAAEVLAFERAVEAAVVRGDVAYVERVSAPDLSFTYGNVAARHARVPACPPQRILVRR
jgi:hypothetical protein